MNLRIVGKALGLQAWEPKFGSHLKNDAMTYACNPTSSQVKRCRQAGLWHSLASSPALLAKVPVRLKQKEYAWGMTLCVHKQNNKTKTKKPFFLQWWTYAIITQDHSIRIAPDTHSVEFGGIRQVYNVYHYGIRKMVFITLEILCALGLSCFIALIQAPLWSCSQNI